MNRKTSDEYQLSINYGQGFEHEVSETSWANMKERLADYRANCPEYPVRWKRVRVPVGDVRQEARDVLRSCGIDIGADYHALPSARVDALTVAADRAKYRKPANANGSRARYFHDMLQRRAKRAD